MVRVIDKINKFFEKRTYAKRGIVISHDVDYGNVHFDDFVNVAHHAQISNSNIGRRTSVGRYSKIQMSDIGKYCSISWDVTIGALEHPVHAISSHAFTFRRQFGICSEDTQIPHKRVTIGCDVWIGCGAIIMPGITIGDGAIIGAGGVVTRNVDPYEIVAGCPAKHIGWRFSKEIKDKIHSLKWWDFPDDELKEYLEYFSPQVDLEKDDRALLKIIELHEKRDGKR